MNVRMFAEGFLEELQKYLEFSHLYYKDEFKKICSKLKFLCNKNLGFKIFCSKENDLCIALLTYSAKIEIIAEIDVQILLCENLFVKSLLNKAMLTEETNLQMKNYIKNMHRNSLFKLEKNSKVVMTNVNLIGGCFFVGLDETSESIMINTHLTIQPNLPNLSLTISKGIPFMYIGNVEKFTKETGKNLFVEIINIAKFIFETKSEDKQSAELLLNNLIMELGKLLMSDDTSEKEIEDFFTTHPYLLKLALNLENPILQPRLPDRDLKPDLIAFDVSKGEWIILDYKLPKYQKLTTDRQKKRLKLNEKVNDLIAQLHDYVDYFNDSLNRKKFQEKYGIYVEIYPYAIGLIGFTKNPDEKKNFNRAKKRAENNRIKIYTYDQILDILKQKVKIFKEVSIS